MDFAAATQGALGACLSSFGETVTYTPGIGVAKSISGIFGAVSAAVEVGEGVFSRSVAPRLGIRLSDLDNPPKKADRVTIRSIVYRVDDIEEDGQGGASLGLHKV